jgi:hypothetical protein
MFGEPLAEGKEFWIIERYFLVAIVQMEFPLAGRGRRILDEQASVLKKKKLCVFR